MYPTVFDQAKNEYYAGGYEHRWTYSNCKQCRHYQHVDGMAGCWQGKYPIPIIAGPTRKKCPKQKDVLPCAGISTG